MAKVSGPIHSLEAHGALAGQLIAQTWKGRPYIRKLTKPTNPKSAAQTGERAMLGFLANLWKQLTTSDQAEWAQLATAANTPAYNAFIGHNMARWQIGLYPRTTPADPVSDPYTPTLNLAATYLTRQVRLTIAPGATAWTVSIGDVPGDPPTPLLNGVYLADGEHPSGPYARGTEPNYWLAYHAGSETYRLSAAEDPDGQTDYFLGGPTLPTNLTGQGTWTGQHATSEATASGTSDPAAALAIFRAKDAPPTATRQTAIIIAKLAAAGTATLYDKPPTPGTWYYLAVPFSLDGRSGSQTPPVTAVATE